MCCMHVLFGYQLIPDILDPLSRPACERICCHLCIQTIIFWRFSPYQWKTRVFLKAWRDICDAARMTALADGLYLLLCYLYVVCLILISFDGYYMQENITIKSTPALNVSQHGFLSSCVDACIYIVERVSDWLACHLLRFYVCLFVKNRPTGDLFMQRHGPRYSLKWNLCLPTGTLFCTSCPSWSFWTPGK